MASSTVCRSLAQVLRQQALRTLGAPAAATQATQHQHLRPVQQPLRHQYRLLHYSRGRSTGAASSPSQTQKLAPSILSALPGHHLSARVMFDDNKTADFKYIWLRDNCKCSSCVDVGTNQRLLYTHSLDLNIQPKSVSISEAGDLNIVWDDPDQHASFYTPKWLLKYGKSFFHNTLEVDNADHEATPVRSEPMPWDRTSIWKDLPELSYKEFTETDAGLLTWLDMFHKYGVAILRGVPAELDQIVDVVKRFAYVRETRYGTTFNIISQSGNGSSHVAFTGVALPLHTDLNYRDLTPGMLLMHCLKANDPSKSETDPGGRSMYVDGFRVARWLEENEPTAFHILTSTPVRFSIKNDRMLYSAIRPVICTNSDGDITEIHCNNRTMDTLQAPTHVVTSFYHAYKLFSQKLSEPSNILEFNLVPGDLVAFNNRRTLHARTAFDAVKVSRHLQGCFVDMDDVLSIYDQLLVKKHQLQA